MTPISATSTTRLIGRPIRGFLPGSEEGYAPVLRPMVFYRWGKELFEKGASAFEQKRQSIWVPHNIRDPIVDFVRRPPEKTQIGAGPFMVTVRQQFLRLAGTVQQLNEHKAWVPRE